MCIFSQAYAPLLSRSPTPLMPFPVKRELDSPFTPFFDPKDDRIQPLVTEHEELTVRERLGIAACLSLLRMQKDGLVDGKHLDAQEKVQAFLLHLAVLKHCTLLERQHWVGSQRCHSRPKDFEFLRQVIEMSWALLEKDEWMAKLNVADENWDLYDAIDGSLFHFILETLRTSKWLPSPIIQSWQHLWLIFRSGADQSFSEHLPELTHPEDEALPRDSDGLQVSALPFSHPVLNDFLQDIKLKESQGIQDKSPNPVFEDLHHWHNTKLLLPTRKIERLGFFAMKRRQTLLASIVAYSASLTNARGKLIDPEIIVVKKDATTSDSKNKKAMANNGKANKGKENKNKPQSKKPGRQGNRPGGKESALRAVEELRKQKDSAKQDNTTALWNKTCRELEKEHSLLARYLKALVFLTERPKDGTTALGYEVHLYLCHVLAKLWAKARPDARSESKNEQTTSNYEIYHANPQKHRIVLDCAYLEMASRNTSCQSLQDSESNSAEIGCLQGSESSSTKVNQLS